MLSTCVPKKQRTTSPQQLPPRPPQRRPRDALGHLLTEAPGTGRHHGAPRRPRRRRHLRLRRQRRRLQLRRGDAERDTAKKPRAMEELEDMEGLENVEELVGKDEFRTLLVRSSAGGVARVTALLSAVVSLLQGLPGWP